MAAASLIAAALAAGCSEVPRGPFCGNGVVDEGEECDDADGYDNDDCLPACVRATCGDGVVRSNPHDDADFEPCDPGGADTAQCDSDCSHVACGDGHVNPAHEVCDDGNTRDLDGCRGNCRSDERCGNGIIDDHLPNRPPDILCYTATQMHTGCAEVCDDGNNVSGDGCSENCLSDETCGNQILDVHGNGTTNDPELCDDGNRTTGDECPNDCQGH